MCIAAVAVLCFLSRGCAKSKVSQLEVVKGNSSSSLVNEDLWRLPL